MRVTRSGLFGYHQARFYESRQAVGGLGSDSARADNETMKSTSIKVGDKFIKPEVPNMVWIVTQIVEIKGMPPHAKLIVQGHLRGSMTISLDALTDQNLYRRFEEGSP